MNSTDNQAVKSSEQQLSPTAEQLDFLRAYPDSTPFVIVNLLKFKGQAGAERYWKEYTPPVTEIAHAAGGRVIWKGRAEGLVIGAPPHDWDGVMLMRWPSKKAFFDMMNHPGFPATQEIRIASLERTALLLASELGHD